MAGEVSKPLRAAAGGEPGAGNAPGEVYLPVEVERRWQERWKADGLYEVDVGRVDPEVKFYNLVEFPYPSAEGLHVGHAYTYAGADTYGRYQRMRGRVTFQPIGFDAFGIHTENYALRVGADPSVLTRRTITHYRGQLERLGAAFAWRHELSTSDPGYYRWTQWIFLRLYGAGLAERRAVPVVWCPSCLTVLANEQVEGEVCERCGTRVVTRVMDQWFLRMTAYAEKLLEGLGGLDWPEEAKKRQRDWIGRSAGVEIDFELPGGRGLPAFTTRPDTLYGVTFLALPPQHPDLEALVAGGGREAEVRAFTRARMDEPDLPATRWRGQVQGVATGVAATHPVTGAPVPLVVADHVIASYGTGAVMGVPAHDERDWELAAALGLPVRRVVEPPTAAAGGTADGPWTGPGTLTDSGPFTGMASGPGGEAVADWLERHGRGQRAVRYRLHDWLISRQRYWGPPIPIVYCGACGTVPVREQDLPVELPAAALLDVRPTGTASSPLAAVASFVHTTCPACGGPARRETDVTDTFLDSAWYFLRYPSSAVTDRPWAPGPTARMLPVDCYAGGPEHVTRHHLYARFLCHALHDLGLLGFAEPFPTLWLHGLLIKDGAKMSKSRGNVIDPDVYIDRVGADNLRMYLLFLGPWQEGGDFSDRGLAGIQRFTARVWRLLTQPHQSGTGDEGPVPDLGRVDRMVAAVERGLERRKFNTAIAALMELARWLREHRAHLTAVQWDHAARTFVLLLAPFAPHLAEELWARLGGAYSVHQQRWPTYDPATPGEEGFDLVVQVNGRRRDTVRAPAGVDADTASELALASERVRRHLNGARPTRVVFVPGRLINLIS